MKLAKKLFDVLAVIAVACMAVIFFSFASAQAARADEDITMVATGTFPAGIRSTR